MHAYGMGIVHLWDEWKLRTLVQASLYIQIFLSLAAVLRKRRVPQWVRFLIWLTFLGSDAIATYALATLFNINGQQEWVSVHRNRANWQTLWAPILLMHIGGLDAITAYNIEDNELWKRHVFTALSQIAVAIYVFRKSWSGEKLLLAAGICFFIAGIFKCSEKPLALKSASINSISNAPPTPSSSTRWSSSSTDSEGDKLVEYLKAAASAAIGGREPAGDGDRRPLFEKLKGEPYGLFVDGVLSYPDRLDNLKYMVAAAHRRSKKEEEEEGEEEEVLYALGSILSKTFDRFYTKHEMVNLPGLWLSGGDGGGGGSGSTKYKRLCKTSYIFLRVVICFYLPYGVSLWAFFTFTNTRAKVKAFKEDVDRRITFDLMIGTAVLQVFATLVSFRTMVAHRARRCANSKQQLRLVKILIRVFLWLFDWAVVSSFTDHVAQYNLIGYLARNRKYRWLRRLLLVGKDSVDQLWCMKACESPSSIKRITNLVQDHIISGWEDIRQHVVRDDAAAGAIVDSFHRFNDSRGQRALSRHGGGCLQLQWSLQRSFDESVLLWHLTTDLCFYDDKRAMATSHNNDDQSSSSPKVSTDGGDDSRRTSREISNYMAYLLFVKPDMLMVAGARRSLFKDAYHQLEELINNKNPSSPAPSSTQQANTSASSLGTATNKKEELALAQKIIHQLKLGEGEGEGTTPTAGSQHLAQDAWFLYKGLMGIGTVEGEKAMWSVIQGVWVEMLCFSAGKCRGYLHAKSLGNGGEYLSCVWLLMSYMGMESLAEKLQRSTELPTGGGEVDLSGERKECGWQSKVLGMSAYWMG